MKQFQTLNLETYEWDYISEVEAKEAIADSYGPSMGKVLDRMIVRNEAFPSSAGFLRIYDPLDRALEIMKDGGPAIIFLEEFERVLKNRLSS